MGPGRVEELAEKIKVFFKSHFMTVLGTLALAVMMVRALMPHDYSSPFFSSARAQKRVFLCSIDS